MTQREFESLFIQAMNSARKQSWFPKDTGNMAYNSFKAMWLGNNKFRMYFDNQVAPYVVYTNEPWKRGKNPNQYWIENRLMPYLASYIGRKLNATRVKRI